MHALSMLLLSPLSKHLASRNNFGKNFRTDISQTLINVLTHAEGVPRSVIPSLKKIEDVDICDEDVWAEVSKIISLP